MMRRFAVGIWALALSLVLAPASYADPSHGFGPAHGEGKAEGGGGEGGDDGTGIQHVLLISIDGMHALDFTNCAKGLSGVNGGNPYCPNLAALATHGVNYLDTSASKPSDSFPGLMAIVTGGSPRTAGAFYDVAYDRSLQPPALATGNGLAAGSCTPGQIPTGTSTEYEEGIDFDQTQLNGGAPSGDGGANSIDTRRLPRDPANDCLPVLPHNFLRVNTIFGVVKAAGGYTAWADKHPAYEAVNGPGDGHNVDDFFGPEINSVLDCEHGSGPRHGQAFTASRWDRHRWSRAHKVARSRPGVRGCGPTRPRRCPLDRVFPTRPYGGLTGVPGGCAAARTTRTNFASTASGTTSLPRARRAEACDLTSGQGRS